MSAMNDEKYLYNHWRLNNKMGGAAGKGQAAADVFRARPEGNGKAKAKVGGGKEDGGKKGGSAGAADVAAGVSRVRGPRDPAWLAPPQPVGLPGNVRTGRDARTSSVGGGAGGGVRARAPSQFQCPTPKDAAKALKMISEETGDDGAGIEEGTDEDLLETPPARQVEAYIRGYNRTMTLCGGTPPAQTGSGKDGSGGEVNAAAMQQQKQLKQRQAQQKELEKQLEEQQQHIQLQQMQLEQQRQLHALQMQQQRDEEEAAQQAARKARGQTDGTHAISPMYYPRPEPIPTHVGEEENSRAALNGSIGQLQAQVAALQRELRAERDQRERWALGQETSRNDISWGGAEQYGRGDREADLSMLLRQSEDERLRLEASRNAAHREAVTLRSHVAGLMREAAVSRQRAEDTGKAALGETAALRREVARLESELCHPSRNQGPWQAGVQDQSSSHQATTETQIQLLQSALRDAQDEVARERGRAAELERELCEWETGRKATSPAVKDDNLMRRRIEDAEIRAATLSKQLSNVQRRFAAERAEWQAAMAERSMASPAGSDVSVELLDDAGETLRDAREEVEAERARGAQRLADMQSESEQMRRKLERALRESVDRVADLEVELESADKRAQAAEAELRRQPKTPAKAPGFVMSPVVKVGMLEASLRDAKREAKEARQEAKSASEEVAGVRQHLDAERKISEAMQAKCTTLESKLERAKEQVIHLEEQSRLLLIRSESKGRAASRGEIMELEEEVANLRAQLERAQNNDVKFENPPSLMGSPSDAHVSARELRRELAEEKQMRADAAALAEQVKAELAAVLREKRDDGELDELKANLEKYRLLSEALRVDNRAYKEAARSLEADVQTLQADKRALAQDKKALQEDKKGLAEEVRLARAATERERATLEGLRERLADVEAQLVALRSAQQIQFGADGSIKPRTTTFQAEKGQGMATPANVRSLAMGNSQKSSISPDLEAAVARIAPALGLRVSIDSIESVPRLNLAVSPVPTSNSESSDDIPMSPSLSGRKPLGDANVDENSSREFVKPYSSNVQRSLEETSASIGSKKVASRSTRSVSREEMDNIIELRKNIETDIKRLQDRRESLLAKGAGKKGAESHIAMELATAGELLRRREAQLESVGMLQHHAEVGASTVPKPTSGRPSTAGQSKSPRRSAPRVNSKVAAFR